MMWSDGQPITADDFLFWYEDVYSNQELMPTPSSVMVIVSFAALLLTWVLASPIGIYSAVQQYSIADYAFTFIGLIGLAVPNFLLALVLLYLGFIPTNIHLIGVDPEHDAEKSIFLLGADIQGRDLWARLILASRISMTIGLVGVTLSLFLGVSIGDVSGLYGGLADTLIQRVIEILHSIPTIPIWMGLGGILPRDWSILQVFFAITIIISLGRGAVSRLTGGGFRGLGTPGRLHAGAHYLRA